MSEQLERALDALGRWFDQLSHAMDRVVASCTEPDSEMAARMRQSWLESSARKVEALEPPFAGCLSSTALLLWAASLEKRTETAFLDALRNVVGLRRRLVEFPELQRHLGSPAAVFYAHFVEALRNAGLCGPTVLDEANRKVAVRVAVQWGLCFLCAAAFEWMQAQGPQAQASGKDLMWVGIQVGSALPS